MIEKWKSDYEKCKTESSQRLKAYETMLKSKESSEAQQVRGLVGRALEYGSLDMQSSDIIILWTIYILGINVEILRLTIDNINTELQQSGILEKAKHLGNILKLEKEIEEFKELLRSQYERMKKRRESREKDLSYVS